MAASTRKNVLAATTTTAASATHIRMVGRVDVPCACSNDGLDLVDEHQLSGYIEIVLVDEHVHRTHGIRPIDAAAELPDDAFRPQPGGHDLGLEP